MRIRSAGSTTDLQALKLGQHSPAGTGAGVPSGQIFKSMVQGTPVQFTVATTDEEY